MDFEAILATIGGLIAALWAGWKKYFSDKESDDETPKKKELSEKKMHKLSSSSDDLYEDEKEERIDLKNDVLDALVAQADIYTALGEAIEKTGAKRLLLLHANNCGDRILYTATQLYATVFAEVHNGAPPVRKYYQGRPIVDPHYLMMLRKVAQERKAILIVDEMSDDMEIKSVYQRANIEEAHVYLTHVETGKIWYISAGFENKPTDPHTDMLLKDCANQICNILQRPIFNPEEEEDE